MRWTTLVPGLVAALALSPAAAGQLVEDFDVDTGAWEARPSFIGNGGTPGWRVVSNAGERATRTSPTGSQATYYWRLEQDFDLTGATSAQLTVKYDFRGHQYHSFRVLVGPEGATKLAQYTVVHEDLAATGVTTRAIDLAAHAGSRVRLRLQLRKASGVVESRIGLYVHRIELDAGMAPAALPASDIRIGAFNALILGQSKLSKPDVMAVLIDLLRRYDLVLVQEIRDVSETTDDIVLDLLNDADGGGWALLTSGRLGRSSVKEQYAYYYRTAKLQPLGTFQVDDGVDDGTDPYEREPYAARFEVVGKSFDFGVIGLHAKPKASGDPREYTYEEMTELPASQGVVQAAWSEPDLVLWGDLNADCTYLRASQRATLPLFTDTATYQQWIPATVDTTTSNTDCAYDRIATMGGVTPLVVAGSGQAWEFGAAMGIGRTLERRVSDHWPVEIVLRVP